MRAVDLAHGGGRTLLRLHDNRLVRLLQCAFPEHQWDPQAFASKAPRGYWSDVNHRRLLLEKVAKEMDVRSPEEWGCVAREDVRRLGGVALLHNHGGDMRAMLEKAFPEVQWAKFLPDNVWTADPFCSHRKRREFFDSMAREKGIHSAKGWECVRRVEVLSRGGKRLLERFHDDLRSALEEAYPEEDFFGVKIHRKGRDRITKGILDDPSEQRRLMDGIAKELGVSSPADWRSVSSVDVAERGGAALVVRHGSLFKALSNIYSERQWDLFECRPYVPHGYWENHKNVTALMKKVKRELNIQSDEEWSRVSYAQLRTVPGAASMLSQVTLREALFSAFGLEFPSGSLGSGKKSSQYQLLQALSKLLL